MRTSDNIFDLTERDSARTGAPHSQLLIRALKAIVKGKLPAHFSSDLPTREWLGLIRGSIPPLERNPRFYVRWFRLTMVDVNYYRAWRGTGKQQSTADWPRLRPASREDVVATMKSYVESERHSGRHTSQKRAWDYAKEMTPRARYKQVIDALRFVEGRKERGRPRLSQGC